MVLNIPYCRSMLLPGEMAMRKQFVLDKRTNKLLEELAAYNGGNRSLIVRQAIQVYSDMEDRLDKIEADPAFQAMMEESDRAIREGRVTPHEEVVRMSRALSRRKAKKR
jgi:predicted transcriptional regulator